MPLQELKLELENNLKAKKNIDTNISELRKQIFSYDEVSWYLLNPVKLVEFAEEEREYCESVKLFESKKDAIDYLAERYVTAYIEYNEENATIEECLNDFIEENFYRINFLNVTREDIEDKFIVVFDETVEKNQEELEEYQDLTSSHYR